MHRKVTWFAVAALKVTILTVGSAAAVGPSAGGYTDGTGGGVRVDAPGSVGAVSIGAGGGARSTRECAYFAVVSGQTHSVGSRLPDTSVLEVGTPVVLQCRDIATGDLLYSALQYWDPATAADAAPSAGELAQDAASSLTLPGPAVRTWPTDGSGLVNLPVWLRVDNWAPLAASASAAGLTATVEATPVRAVWTLGPDRVVCTDAGTEWRPGLEVNGSSCSYTFRHSSGAEPDGRFTVSVAVVWQLRWSATDGQVGDLGEVTSPASTFGLRVEESQALVAPGRN